MLASEGQHALAAADPDDEPALREYDGDLTGFGPRRRAETTTLTSKATRATLADFMISPPKIHRPRCQPPQSVAAVARTNASFLIEVS